MTPDSPATRTTMGGGALRFDSQLSSFTAHLRVHAPELLPENRFDLGANGGRGESMTGRPDIAPHGTTIVALTFAGGVLIAGDRRATMGNLIASRDVEKVYVTDDHSAAGIAGTAGIAIELGQDRAINHHRLVEGLGHLDGFLPRHGINYEKGVVR